MTECSICTETSNNHTKCNECTNLICKGCIKKMKTISVVNGNILMNFICPFCRNINCLNVFDEIKEKDLSIHLMKDVFITALSKSLRFDEMKRANKKLENQVEEMYMELEYLKQNTPLPSSLQLKVY